MPVLVEEVRVGDRFTLRNGRTVQVEELHYDGDQIFVRWHAGPMYRRPHRLAGEREQLGTFAPRRRGDTIELDRVDTA